MSRQRAHQVMPETACHSCMLSQAKPDGHSALILKMPCNYVVNTQLQSDPQQAFTAIKHM